MKGVAVVALIASCAPACTFGLGSAHVGQWRERDQVDYEVCVEDDAGNCAERREVVSHLPPRRYWGMIFNYPSIGASSVSADGVDGGFFRLELSAEYLRGYGRLAFGVRAGSVHDLGWNRSMTAFPVVTGLVHYSLSERLTLYGGGGGAPYMIVQHRRDGEIVEELTSHAVLRAVVGIQLAIARYGETYWILGLEGDTLGAFAGDVDYRSSGLVFNFGIFI